MHEFHSVKLFIDEIAKHIAPSGRVQELLVRRSPTFTEEAARMAFLHHAKGTPLEQARIVFEPLIATISCPCGYKGAIRPEDDGAPMLCPSCQSILAIPPSADLELVKITYDAQRP